MTEVTRHVYQFWVCALILIVIGLSIELYRTTDIEVDAEGYQKVIGELHDQMDDVVETARYRDSLYRDSLAAILHDTIIKTFYVKIKADARAISPDSAGRLFTDLLNRYANQNGH